MAEIVLTPRDVARFWAKVDRRGPDECWPWMRSDFRGGYGQFSLRGTPVRASRVVATIAHGPCPATGAQALHHCDNPPCCNPAHIYWGTHVENTTDRSVRGRLAFGSRHGRALLSEADVRDLRARHAQGADHASLAAAFGIALSTVGRITRHETWRHVA
jgi:hypothetical protein